MVNPSGRIGRDGEHQAIQYLNESGFYDLEREGRRAPSLDIIGTQLPVPNEVKRQGALAIPAWTREMERRHSPRWALWVIQRDARRNLHPDLMIVPAVYGAHLQYLDALELGLIS
jgi:hypothetical protein